MTEKTYNFGEKTKENYKTKEGWMELPVVHHPKYAASKAKAIELIESKKYGLDESDFWILKNASGSKEKAKLYYTGLIISHNGCLKINDKLEAALKFKPSAVSFLKDQSGEKVMQYVCEEQGIYEFGEITPSNCKNEYLYAMVIKRLMDRVILKNSKIGFFGIYSDSESDDFKENLEEKKPEPKNKTGITQNLADGVDEDMKEVFNNKNQADYEKIKKAIVGCGSVEELEAEKLKFKKEANSLKKYRPELYAEIAEISLKEEAKILGIDIAELTALKKKKKEQMGE